jgi:hypothetical protein
MERIGQKFADVSLEDLEAEIERATGEVRAERHKIVSG